MSAPQVFFTELPLEAGEHFSGKDADTGERVIVMMDEVAWYVVPLMILARVFRWGWLACWTVQRGMSMHVVGTYPEQ